jgi:CHASE3 domain sensor protein
MNRSWTFGGKLALGFALTVALAIAMAIIAVVALNRSVANKDRVINVYSQNLTDAAKLEAALAKKSTAARDYILSGDPKFLQREQDARQDLLQVLARLKNRAFTERGKALLADIELLEVEHQKTLDKAHALRESKASYETMARYMSEVAMPMRDRMQAQVETFSGWEQKLLEDGQRESSEAAVHARDVVIIIAALVCALAAGIAVVLTRALTRQIGSAVQNIQSSSAELQTTATQQATGAREQATAMAEITTTISELLATSRQIAESAQRVSQISGETANAAAAGDGVVQKAHESLTTIKQQVDAIVAHMLDLGRKSQQIGSILEIINELAEQTNILSINATIEAAGAGESGKRFAVVADEIRKLADRVANSTKDIRTLIEEIRSAVNTTVMATEGGTKAVDAGAREFSEVTSSLNHISALVATTSEAAREIELSTKQQATAVEQVNMAISNVAQVSRETETSTAQALQTASQLAGLSRDLNRLIRASANGTS